MALQVKTEVDEEQCLPKIEDEGDTKLFPPEFVMTLIRGRIANCIFRKHRGYPGNVHRLLKIIESLEESFYGARLQISWSNKRYDEIDKELVNFHRFVPEVETKSVGVTAELPYKIINDSRFLDVDFFYDVKLLYSSAKQSTESNPSLLTNIKVDCSDFPDASPMENVPILDWCDADLGSTISSLMQPSTSGATVGAEKEIPPDLNSISLNECRKLFPKSTAEKGTTMGAQQKDFPPKNLYESSQCSYPKSTVDKGTSVTDLEMLGQIASLPLVPSTLLNAGINLPPAPQVNIHSIDRRDDDFLAVLNLNFPPSTSAYSYAPLKAVEVFLGFEELNTWNPILVLESAKFKNLKPLPMAVRLNGSEEGIHHCSIRAIDAFGRCGPFSLPVTIAYTRPKFKRPGNFTPYFVKRPRFARN
ncbi:hypothetical protein NPIL_630421 [Nephila pilipes]|uniref:Activating transcription factor 7-interacting protein Fn3 domain-containing protein n=1 Tax=Nephila pilipes TaxID=299642 RepID=A0A8X6J124_NEPPI|nr:hypothetical protein NPIL_630421 [Nephila pilipes]